MLKSTVASPVSDSASYSSMSVFVPYTHVPSVLKIAMPKTKFAVSGKLDLRMGGPGFSFFEPNDNYVRVYTPKKEFGPETFRRMVYGTVVRQRPDGVFGVFDCPDAGQIAPKRTRSTTPLQALNLLNSGFIMQQSEFFAERLKSESTQIEAQASRACPSGGSTRMRRPSTSISRQMCCASGNSTSPRPP